MLQQSAWGLGLALPFGISLALRAGLDKAARTTSLEPAADYVGGGLCGSAAGVITAGFVVMSIGMLRIDTAAAAVLQDPAGTGQPREPRAALDAVDDIVAGLYGRSSVGIFASGTPMGNLLPNMADVPEMLRSTEGGGRR